MMKKVKEFLMVIRYGECVGAGCHKYTLCLNKAVSVNTYFLHSLFRYLSLYQYQTTNPFILLD